jgi:hypothetical protein
MTDGNMLGTLVGMRNHNYSLSQSSGSTGNRLNPFCGRTSQWASPLKGSTPSPNTTTLGTKLLTYEYLGVQTISITLGLTIWRTIRLFFQNSSSAYILPVISCLLFWIALVTTYIFICLHIYVSTTNVCYSYMHIDLLFLPISYKKRDHKINNRMVTSVFFLLYLLYDLFCFPEGITYLS